MVISRKNYHVPPPQKILYKKERFAWLPIKVDDGRWIWLETYLQCNKNSLNYSEFNQTKKY